MLQSLTARRRVPILGKIRLGERRENQGGKEYPINVPYFVTEDAPGVAAVYGEKPTSIEIIFPTNDLDSVVPAAFRWFSAGRRDAEGNPIGGKRICQGNGPLELADGTLQPGTATWYDRTRKPPEAEIIALDSAAGRCSRVCWGDRCVDAKDERGFPKCRMGMQIFVILPRVSFDGVFQIDTTSRNSIPQIYDQLMFMKSGPRGGFAWVPFRLYKKEIPVNPIDPKTGEERPGTQQIIALEVWEGEFNRLYGESTRAVLTQLKGSAQAFLPSQEDVEAATMEDNYPMLEAAAADAAVTAQAQVSAAEAVACDPEVVKGFDEMGRLFGNKPFSPRDRLIQVRKKEGEAAKTGKPLREVVLAAIMKSCKDEAERQSAAPAAVVSPPPAAQPQSAKAPEPTPPRGVMGSPLTPQPDADGIM